MTGGGALVGFHLRHRTTRDLDLFFHGEASVADLRKQAAELLRSAGFEVAEIRSTPMMATLNCRGQNESVIVDLVAEPVANIEAPEIQTVGKTEIRVDTRHEILVNKVCSLLHRSEPRDLIDIQALVAAGGDLDRALRDAPRKDGGFSPLTLGWILRGWDVASAARTSKLDVEPAKLVAFRDDLLRIVAADD